MSLIALNGRFTGTPNPTGTQTASFHLFEAILAEPSEFRFVVFADSRFSGVASWGDSGRVTFVPTPFQDWSRGRAHLWEQFQAPVLAARRGCRIMHHPMTTCPAWQNRISHVVTLHDFNFLLHPEWYQRSFRMVYALCAMPGLRRCRRVVAISDYVREQAARIFSASAPRLRTIHNGVKPMVAKAPREGNYLFAAGSLQPHKNLPRLIEAFQRVRAEFPGLELVVAGRPQPRFAAQPELAALLASPGIRLVGYLLDDELANAYAGARAFCFPSLEEGFGLPVLEAMTLGCPVLTSNVSCLPEISGPAVQVDPYSVEAIAEGLRMLLRLSPGERDALTAGGREWAARFSWQAAAKKYLALYRELAS